MAVSEKCFSYSYFRHFYFIFNKSVTKTTYQPTHQENYESGDSKQRLF